MRKCLDFLGQEIRPGNTIVYPGRQKSTMWMNKATVLTVTDTGDGWSLRVARDDGDRVVKCVDRIVVIHDLRKYEE
jgi:hypothetical protein